VRDIVAAAPRSASFLDHPALAPAPKIHTDAANVNAG
jgi:hypothetical protein